MSDLLRQLADGGSEHTEYGLHVLWPGSGDEDWMKCSDLGEQQYRRDFWTNRGLVCTPLVRTVTVGGWSPSA